jgi:hypothetical protein
MKYVYLTLNWGFGLLFGLTGLASLFELPLVGLCLIALSLLLLPPARTLAYKITNRKLPFLARAISVVVLFIVFGVIVGQYQEKEAAELAARKVEKQVQLIAKARDDNIEHFKNNREQILSSVSEALANKDYQYVMLERDRYLLANDADLINLYVQAKNAIAEIEKAEQDAQRQARNGLADKKEAEQEAQDKAWREARTKEILAELKAIPASEFEENKTLYQQLARLNPDNTAYREKLDHYSQKLKEKFEKERKEQEKLKADQEARIAKFGEPPTKSSWDGSYYIIERYLKRIANDPASLELNGCTKVYHTETGWLVGCDYGAKNAFGGMIRQSNWFTIVRDQVIQMDDASAYHP